MASQFPAFSFHFLTLFPETIAPWLTTSILGRAYREGLFSFKTYQLRDFSRCNHLSVDDTPYGGGAGMVLKVEPLVDAVESIRNTLAEPSEILFFSPTGQRLNTTLLQNFSATNQTRHFILVCGHYEGADQRFLDHWVDWEISIGDFVITGGELPALIFTDALVRTLHGVLGNREGLREESFSWRDPNTGSLLLEYPQFTRPRTFRGHGVPEVLLNGNHKAIEEWRLAQARERTHGKLADSPDSKI